METTAQPAPSGVPYPVPPTPPQQPAAASAPAPAGPPQPVSPAAAPVLPPVSPAVYILSCVLFIAVSYLVMRLCVTFFPSVVDLTKREHMQLDGSVFTPATAFIRMGQTAPPVTSLVINSSDYVKSVPETIGNVPSLTTLTIINQPITSLPESIGNLTNLESITIYNTPIASLPESIGNLTNLKTLVLAGTNLTKLPASFGNLTNLESVNLSHNRFAAFPPQLAMLPQLMTLELTGNPIRRLPAPIHSGAQTMPQGYPPAVRQLYLGNTNITFTTLQDLTTDRLSLYY